MQDDPLDGLFRRLCDAFPNHGILIADVPSMSPRRMASFFSAPKVHQKLCRQHSFPFILIPAALESHGKKSTLVGSPSDNKFMPSCVSPGLLGETKTQKTLTL